MGTRAMFTFRDKDGTHNVYRHWDGHPEDSVLAIKAALKLAWPLPRFEAGEFAAAFVAANKTAAGNYCLLVSGRRKSIAPDDLQYRYEVSLGEDGKLIVAGYEVDIVAGQMGWIQLFEGPLDDSAAAESRLLRAKAPRKSRAKSAKGVG